MEKNLQSLKANFGTLPVFLTAISTILGAVMFLRFGYAVGEVGFAGTLLIILVAHMVTIWCKYWCFYRNCIISFSSY